MSDDSQVFEFDKFMDSIERIEKSRHVEQTPNDQITPQREYNIRYRELPQNRVRYEKNSS